jgi:hypothetical protein
VVPRAWTIYFAEMAEREVPDRVPDAWLALASEKAGAPVPDRLSEEAPPMDEPDHELDRVLAEVRRAHQPAPNDPMG